VDATLEKRALFDFAIFKKGALFVNASFNDASFNRTTFQSEATFRIAKFDEEAQFIETSFLGGAEFGLSSFNSGVSFKSAVFSKDTSFERAKLGHGTSFNGVTLGESLVFRGQKEIKDEKGKIIVEEEQIFKGEVDFRLIKFRMPKEVIFQHVNLEKARFLYTRLDEVQFIDVVWPKSERENRKFVYDEIAEYAPKNNYALIAQLYRQLKKNYEDQRAYPEAGDFHYGEMEMTLKQYQAAVNKWLKYEEKKLRLLRKNLGKAEGNCSIYFYLALTKPSAGMERNRKEL